MIFHLSSVQVLTSSFHHISFKHLSLTPPSHLPPLSSFPSPLPRAALPWHAAGTEEGGVSSEWVHDQCWQSMLCCNWNEAAQRVAATWSGASCLVMKLRFQECRRCMILANLHSTRHSLHTNMISIQYFREVRTFPRHNFLFSSFVCNVI